MCSKKTAWWFYIMDQVTMLSNQGRLGFILCTGYQHVMYISVLAWIVYISHLMTLDGFEEWTCGLNLMYTLMHWWRLWASCNHNTDALNYYATFKLIIMLQIVGHMVQQ